MSRKNALDQYFTKPSLAQHYTDIILDRFGCGHDFLEPCGGTGSFVDALKGLSVMAMDLEPKHPAVEQGNFLEALIFKTDMICVSNPPFENAVEFINKAAEHCKAICMILPRSFRKASIINRLDPFLHVSHDEDCPENSFILDGESYDVSTCFQIWERRFYPRKKIEFKGTYFEIVKKTDDHDAVLRCYGSRSGEVLPDDYDANETTVRRLKSKIGKQELKDALGAINWTAQKSNAASVPTINRIEIENSLEAYFSSQGRT